MECNYEVILMSSYQSHLIMKNIFIVTVQIMVLQRIHEVAASFSHTTLSSILKILSDCIVVVFIISYLVFVSPHAFVILFSLLIFICLIYEKISLEREYKNTVKSLMIFLIK